MKIDGNEINIDDLLKLDEYKKRENGLILRDSQIEVLDRYDIDYRMFSSLSTLLMEIDEVLNEVFEEDLEEVSKELSELNYYEFTNK